MALYVDVILPLSLPGTYTYALPNALANDVATGMRVLVQFGKSKLYSALVYSMHNKQPAYEVKEVIELLDNEEVINDLQFKLWQWISTYYMCSMGDVMTAALPSALKLQSESTIALNPGFDGDASILTDREYLVYEALLTVQHLPLKEVEKITGVKSVFRLLKNMAEKQVVLFNEEVRQKVKPRMEQFLKLTEKCDDPEFMKDLFARLEKNAPRQLDLLMHFLNLTTGSDKPDLLPRKKLLKISGSTQDVLNGLIKKGALEQIQSYDYANFNQDEILKDLSVLNTIQQEALENIRLEFDCKKPVLLHGVTASGKTELFVHLMADVLAKGKQVLYLMPEIALTTQMISRLRKYFGQSIMVYHSRFSENERLLVWNRMIHFHATTENDNGQIIIGARSALFLPFKNLGLIVVDEEHESSYKQFDPAPRYHARDTAIVLAGIHKSNIIMGSATPAIESYFNAENGKYALVTMNKRYADIEMPQIKLVDIKEAQLRKKMKASFSDTLIGDLGMALNRREQAILFQNRRGFATIVRCQQCAHIPGCINCDVTLTYHKAKNLLICHYCGYATAVPKQCPACRSIDIRMSGIGTERIEEDLSIFFPDKVIARLDIDSAKTKHQFQQILNDFENGTIDVLVGTQMVTKGLDFDNVSLVGVINSDNLMGYPDFRATERGFQLISQVSGRAGRRKKQGEVVIQTYNISNPVLSFITSHDYLGFYRAEIAERKKFNYPPFCRLIEMMVKNKDQQVTDAASALLADLLHKQFGKRVFGPVLPIVSRISSYYQRQLMLKIEKGVDMHEVKKIIINAINQMTSVSKYRNCVIQINVDPT